MHLLPALLALRAAGDALVVVQPLDIAGIYYHVTATFGPQSYPGAGVNGSVTIPVPPNGCTAPSNDVSGTIVLATRGECDFIDKVRTAQTAGAIAVVVANDQGEHLFKMYSSDEDTSDVIIPSVFVTTGTGNALPGSTIVLNATGECARPLPRVLASDAPPALARARVGPARILSSPPSPMLTSALARCRADDFGDDDFMHPYFFMAIVLLGLSVTLACTLTATLVGYLAVIFKKRRQRSECRRAVQKLKTKSYTAPVLAEGETEDPTPCTICLEDFVVGEKLKVLPCGHQYHQECIEPWLLEKSSLCPLCKQNITAGADFHAPTPPPAERGSSSSRLESGGGGGTGTGSGGATDEGSLNGGDANRA